MGGVVPHPVPSDPAAPTGIWELDWIGFYEKPPQFLPVVIKQLLAVIYIVKIGK